MGAFPTFGLGRLLGGDRSKMTPQRRRGPGGEPLPLVTAPAPADQVAAKVPPNAALAESNSVALARGVATRARRRARMGSGLARPAGGTLGRSQAGQTAFSTPRSLGGS